MSQIDIHLLVVEVDKVCFSTSRVEQEVDYSEHDVK